MAQVLVPWWNQMHAHVFENLHLECLYVGIYCTEFVHRGLTVQNLYVGDLLYRKGDALF